jgi:glycosyltransferase involved in cell wall biosynthesis
MPPVCHARGRAGTPRVSILLPARNAAPTLRPCLASISRQTERSWECILVDDGSSDDTRTIAEDFARQDPRFRVLSTPPRGLVSALNDGLEHCRAARIARMDSDDVMHRERLAAQADALDKQEDLAALGCHVRLFPRDGLSPRLREYELWLNGMRGAADVERDALVECPIAHPTMMMRRAFADLRYLDRGWPEDYDLVLRALAAGLRIGVVPRRLLAWRSGSGSLSRTDSRYGLDRFTACKAHFLANGFLAGGSRYILWGYGGTGRALCRALAAAGKTPSYIVEVKTGRIGQRIRGAEVIPHGRLPLLRGQPIVVSVARAGPRTEIRGVLAGMGFIEGIDYLCAA